MSPGRVVERLDIFVFEDPAAASRCEGIALELGVLSVGGDAGVTDEIELLGCHSSSVT